MTGIEHMSVDTSRLEEWSRVRAERGMDSSNEPELPLYGGGGNGPVDPSVTIKDYVDARDEAIETRLNSRFDNLPTKSTIWTAVATAAGILAALMAYGGDRFDGGVSVSPSIAKMQTEQAKRDETQDAQLKLMDQKLDVLIKQTAGK